MRHLQDLSLAALQASTLFLAISVALLATMPAPIAAPYVAGNRTFPATPTTEDPFVAGEAAFGASQIRDRAEGSDPAVRETEFESELALRLTEDLGIGLEGAYSIHDPVSGPNSYGFENMEAFIKYQFYESDEHEMLLSAGIVREFGGTGSSRVDADRIGSTTPTFYFGKGFGDLSDGVKYLKPFALTGSIGYQIADERRRTKTEIDPQSGLPVVTVEHGPDFLVLGASLQYSLRYLQGNVEYLGLPTFVGRLTPIVEFAYSTPVTKAFGERPKGILAPGFIYSDIGFDLGAEALIPVTDAAGSGTGFIVRLTVFLDRIVPPLVDALTKNSLQPM